MDKGSGISRWGYMETVSGLPRVFLGLHRDVGLTPQNGALEGTNGP